MHIILCEQGLSDWSLDAILMVQKLQLSGWDSRHRMALFNQHLDTVVHPCDLTLQLLILWKPEQLADYDHSRVSDCSNVLEQRPQVVDQHQSDGCPSRQFPGTQWWDNIPELAVDAPTVVTESHSGTAWKSDWTMASWHGKPRFCSSACCSQCSCRRRTYGWPMARDCCRRLMLTELSHYHYTANQQPMFYCHCMTGFTNLN